MAGKASSYSTADRGDGESHLAGGPGRRKLLESTAPVTGNRCHTEAVSAGHTWEPCTARAPECWFVKATQTQTSTCVLLKTMLSRAVRSFAIFSLCFNKISVLAKMNPLGPKEPCWSYAFMYIPNPRLHPHLPTRSKQWEFSPGLEMGQCSPPRAGPAPRAHLPLELEQNRALTFMYFTSSSVFFSSSWIISLWNVLNC